MGFLVAQMVKSLPAVWETQVRSLGLEDPLEKGMATHWSILSWRISMDRGAWQAAVYGVTKSWTRLSDSHTHTHTRPCCASGLRATSCHSQLPSLSPVHPGRVSKALPQRLPSGRVIPECSRTACFRALAAPLLGTDSLTAWSRASCLDHHPLCFPRSSRTSDTASTVWI